MDSASTTAHDAHHRILEEFRTGSASILIGTQMVGKGHDIPDVSSWVIAPSILSSRTSVRRAHVPTHYAGAVRAGRGDSPGMVVVQTTIGYTPVTAVLPHFESFAQIKLAEPELISSLPLVLIESQGKTAIGLCFAPEARRFSRANPDAT